jgi:flagellar basal-body rod protein FlgF
MNSGFYAACTGLLTRTQALDTIANNLANTSTVGFRATHNIFSSVLATTGNSQLDMVNQDANDYGVLSGTRLDATQGAIVKTGNELDLAMEGSGYFVVKTAADTVYTRGGNLRVSPKNQLTTAQGDLVLNESNLPITLLPGTAVSISPDGTISSNGAISDRLKLVEFPADTQMHSFGGAYYSAPANVTATVARSSMVRQGALESSNVNPVLSVIELINAQREVESMRHVLSMFSTDMDKTAAQDLPRVS